MSLALKEFASRSKALIILHRLYENGRRRRAFVAGNTVTGYGSTHRSWSLDESIRYIDSVYEDYLRYSRLDPEAFRGQNILEVGPGDNLGVALKFLAKGAERVVCLDKFYAERDTNQETAIYMAIRQALPPEQAREFDLCVNLNNGNELNQNRLKYIHGHGIEEADKILEQSSFNFILSRAVIHNVYDLDRAFQVMDKLLTPGGYMLHKIDFTDENMFSSRGMHPLTFLTIPERIYSLMAADSGKPNRKLISYYRDKMEELGYESKILVSGILGERELIPHKERIEIGIDYSDATLSLINEIRPRLAIPFRSFSDQDLAATGIFLIARKPDSL